MGRKVQKTRKQFIDFMMEKGRSNEWAEAEYDRRRVDPSRTTGTDRDTGLPTVECFEPQFEEDYEDNYRTDEVESATKEKTNPKDKDFKIPFGQLGQGLWRRGCDEGVARE